MSVDDFVGTWRFVKGNGYFDYLIEAPNNFSLNAFTLQAGADITLAQTLQDSIVKIEFTRDGLDWQQIYTFQSRTHICNFQLDNPFDEISAEGRDITVVYCQEDEALLRMEIGKAEGHKDARVDFDLKDDELTVAGYCENRKYTMTFQREV